MAHKAEIAELKKMLKTNKNLSKTVRSQIEKRINGLENSIGSDKIKITSSNQSGVQLFGQLLAKKERAPGEKKPSSFRFQIIQTEKRPYWKAESDYGEEMRLGDVVSFIEKQNEQMAKNDSENEFVPITEVVDCDQQQFDLEDIEDPNEIVLLMKVRGKGNKPRLSFGEKPLARYMILRNADQMWISVFADKVASGVENGGYVTVRGLHIDEYEGSSRGNCKLVSESKLDKDELDQEIFDLYCKQYPRFKNSYMKIEEDVPSSWQDRVSKDLQEFLTTPTQICSWPTRNKMGEIIKPDTALFDEPVVGGYYYMVNDDSGAQRKVNQITVHQTVEKYSDGEQTKIMLVVKLNARKSAELLGVTNTKMFEKLAEKHVKNLRWALFVPPNHKSTLALNINDESQKDENMRDFSHGLEYRTMNSTYMIHNFLWYLIKKSLPLDYETAKELLGGQDSLTFDGEDERNPNPYDGSPKSKLGKKFVNLSEYKGSLKEFEKEYEFRILTTDKAKDVAKMMKISDESKRLKMCCRDLTRKTDEDDSDEDDSIIAKVDSDSPAAIFAIHNDLIEDCKENESMRSLERYYNLIENRQEKFQPGQEENDDDDEEDDDDMKVDDKNAAEASTKDKNVSVKNGKKSPKRKRQGDDDNNDEDEEDDDGDNDDNQDKKTKKQNGKVTKKSKQEKKTSKKKEESEDEENSQNQSSEEEEEEEDSDDSS